MAKDQNKTNLIWVFLIVNLIVSCSALILHFTSSKQNIVYVDAIKLISRYKGMEVAKKSFNSQNEAMKLNLDTLNKELQAKMAEYEKMKSKSTKKGIEMVEQLIQSKQKQYYEYEQIINQQYQKREQEMSIQLLKEVNQYIKKYGESKGYSIILASTQMGNIAYGNNALDVTEEVLVGLNASYK